MTSPELLQQYAATTPIPGRPGWRRDADGRDWFSSAWLDPWRVVIVAGGGQSR